MIQQIIDWGEVWPLLIPLFLVITQKKISRKLTPVRYYIFIALLINLAIDLMWKFGSFLVARGWPYDNNFLYNVHSICRFLLFNWFFIRITPKISRVEKFIIPSLFLLFVVLNFIFFERFKEFSSRLLATEAVLLLVYCLRFYLRLLQDDQTVKYTALPEFWVVTGLCIFVTTSFFIFLFYKRLVKADEAFAITIWNIHNISYIILCIFLSKAIYQSRYE